MLICIRRCPYQSWQNIAERIMSTSSPKCLTHTNTSAEYEQLVKNCSSLSEIGKVIQKHPDLHGALQDLMSALLINVGSRFQSMQGKEEEAKEVDRGRRSTLVSGYYSLWRMYSPSKLTPLQMETIKAVKDSKFYTCGSALLPPESAYANIIMREAIFAPHIWNPSTIAQN